MLWWKITKWELGVLTQIGGDCLTVQLLCWMLEEEAWERRRRRMWTQAQFSVPAPQFQSSSPTLCSRQLREHLCHFPHISHHSVRVPHGKCLYFWNSPVSCNVWLCAAQRVKEHRRVHGICLEAIYCLLGKNSGSGRPDDGHHSAQLLSL